MNNLVYGIHIFDVAALLCALNLTKHVVPQFFLKFINDSHQIFKNILIRPNKIMTSFVRTHEEEVLLWCN